MRVTSRIYGSRASKTPDMILEFDIGEVMSNGKWSYGVSNTRHTMKNELIDHLSENDVLDSLKTFIENLLNTPEGPKWVQNPNLRLFYDDENDKPVPRIII